MGVHHADWLSVGVTIGLGELRANATCQRMNVAHTANKVSGSVVRTKQGDQVIF